MDKDIKKMSEQFGRKTVLLPESLDADCYAVYSKEEYINPDERLLVAGKAYKHRLYLYKKNKNSDSNRILSFIVLNPGTANHIEQGEEIEHFLTLAGKEYGAIEIFSIFTLRTIDKIDAVSENAILDAVKCDLFNNDIVLAFGDEIEPTEKYKDISTSDLEKINRVRRIKVDELIKFLCRQKCKGQLFTYENHDLIEFRTP